MVVYCHITGSGVSFPGFLEFVEYNFHNWSIGERGGCRQDRERATDISETGDPPMVVCHPPFLTAS